MSQGNFQNAQNSQTLPQSSSQAVTTDPIRRISDLESLVEYLHSHIKQLESQLNQCVTSGRQTQSTVSKLEYGQQRLLNYTRTLEDYCLELDVSIRKRHMILTGIPEDPSEEPTSVEELDNENNSSATHKIALNTLLAIHDTLIFEDIDCAYHIGKKGTSPDQFL